MNDPPQKINFKTEPRVMTLQDFILSEKKSIRFLRHLAFWIFWGLYFGGVRHFNPQMLVQTGHLAHPLKTIMETIVMLIPQMLMAYPLMYFVLPRYVFKGKFLQAFGWFLLLLNLTLLANALVFIYIPWYRLIWNPKLVLFPPNSSFTSKLQIAYMASLQGALTGSALACSFKLLKHYYVKNVLTFRLQKANTEAQLQLLTAQVHPHFLFNTLNNIYSKSQTESPGSAKMIMELSHILRYILDEGKKHMVPLEYEIQMIKDYINLEKMRYDDKLELHLSFPSHTETYYIAPLILLPFVENCFKHGTSKMLRQPWVNLKIELEDSMLVAKIMNGRKTDPKHISTRKGTGIDNVKQRLELLYRNRYELNISDDEEVFVVNLKIELDREPREAIAEQPIREIVYA